MDNTFFIELVHSIALLLVFAFLFGKRWIESTRSARVLPKVLIGIVVGAIGIFLMFNPWTYQPGHSIDLRTVLLSISGLYLGAVPTLVAIVMMGTYRFFAGGELMLIGVVLVISSGLMGLGWRYLLQKRGSGNSLLSLFMLGLLTHVLMLTWLVFMPREVYMPIIQKMALLLVSLYPFLTMVLGFLMNRQLKSWENEKVKDLFIETEQRFARIMQNINMFYINLDLNGNFISCNKYLLEHTGYSEEELIGKSTVDLLIPPDIKEEAIDIVGELAQNKTEVYYHEEKIRTKDHKILHVLSHITLLKDKAGEVNGISILAENITEKNAIIANLKEAKEKAEESNRLKSVFLQNVSHEIRTPMNAIIGFISLLIDSPIDETTRSQYYDIINKSGERLLTTVNDLIDISQIETQQIKVNKSAINISEILLQLVNTNAPLAAKKNNKITCTSQYLDSTTLLNTDRHLLLSIFSNLINNANKFTDNGTIEIGSYDQENDIVFFVKDTGIGIPQNRHDAIFDRFVQADLTISRTHEGAGLGLSIAKAYAQLLGGDVWVESEEGKGSTFFINLPKDIVIPEQPETEKPEILEKHLCRNCKILVAEDDEMSYLFLKTLLEQKGIQIINAKNGAEAVDRVRNDSEISLVLMDIKMPVMNGEEAIRQIRTFNQDIPIVAQTAYAMPADKYKILETGCNDYISKPIDAGKLFKLLQKYMNPS